MSEDLRSQRKQVSHDRILDAAARALRRNGYAGLGVADVMKEAGLTHGGFYAHFRSREALLAGALARAGQQSAERMARSIAARTGRGASPFRAMIETYLSDEHLTAVEYGCAVAALGSEMMRQTDEVRAASCERVEKLLQQVARVLPAGVPQENAPVIASTMVGALQLARALGDNAEGKRLLAASRKALLHQYDSDHSTEH